MTKKFDELYENIKIGFPISVQNPSREVPYTVGYDMGKELNDEELAFVADIIDDNGRLTNPHHPTNLKVRSYVNQLHALSTTDLVKLASMIGMKHPEVHHNDEIVKAIINHLGEDPKNWKVLSPYIFTESEDEEDLDETAEDDSEWVAHKSEDDNYMFGEDDDEDELDEKIVKQKKFRNGKMVTLKKTDKKNHKVVDGKEVKMKPEELRNRMKAAQKRERSGNLSQKRMKSFKKTMKVKQRRNK